MTDRVSRITLILLAILHVGLALAFASFTPYRASGLIGGSTQPDIGAPDERAHVNYVQHLLDGDGLPWLDVARMKADAAYRAEDYEDHQPPAYYAVEAVLMKITGKDKLDTASGVTVRWPNAIFGAATVVAVFFAALWGFGRNDLAVAAAAFAALLPMNVALSGAVSNDPMLFALLSWGLAFAIRGVKEGWTLKLAIGLGLCCGIAVLTKTTGLVLFPIALLAAALRRPKPVKLAATAAIALVIACPWWVRNQRVYGDPLALNAFNQAFTDTSQHSQIVQIIQAQGGSGEFEYWTSWVGWWTARSFVGVFGYMDIFLNETGTFKTGPGAPNTLYRLSLAALSVLAVGWLLSLKEPWAKENRSVTILNGVMIALVLLLFVRFNNQYFQAQARYLLPAIAPISIGFASGAIVLAKRKPVAGVVALAACLIALDVYCLIRVPAEFKTRTGDSALGNASVQRGVQC